MKNIEIIVDATGSCNLEEIESQLQKIKDELKDNLANATVSFYSFGERLSKNLKLLEIPLSNADKKSFFMGGDNFTEVVRGKVKNNPDTVIFIGDFFEAPLQPSAFKDYTNTQLILIQTSHDKKMDRSLAVDFAKDVKDIVNTKITDVNTYTSLEDIVNPKSQVQNKIGQLRNAVTQNDNNSKLKP